MVCLFKLGEHGDGGRFASSIVAKEDQDLIFEHCQGEVVDCSLLAVLLDEVTDNQAVICLLLLDVFIDILLDESMLLK